MNAKENEFFITTIIVGLMLVLLSGYTAHLYKKAEHSALAYESLSKNIRVVSTGICMSYKKNGTAQASSQFLNEYVNEPLANDESSDVHDDAGKYSKVTQILISNAVASDTSAKK